jgi:hypothetical protein
MTEASIKEAVRDKYGQAAQRVGNGCCGTSIGTDPISSNLYSDQETGALPEAAVAASLGCGNPTALAELKPGETVLDLGSGAAASTFCYQRLLMEKALTGAAEPMLLDFGDRVIHVECKSSHHLCCGTVGFGRDPGGWRGEWTPALAIQQVRNRRRRQFPNRIGACLYNADNHLHRVLDSGWSAAVTVSLSRTRSVPASFYSEDSRDTFCQQLLASDSTARACAYCLAVRRRRCVFRVLSGSYLGTADF